MYCKNCGSRISDDAHFCPKCGEKQDGGCGDVSNNSRLCKVELRRKKKLAYSANVFEVYADGAPVGVLYSGGIVSFELPAGQHQIIVDGGPNCGRPASISGMINGDVTLTADAGMFGIKLTQI